jgi:hypothetical protein
MMSTTMSGTYIADLLTPFCEAASINIREPHRALRKRILVSLSFVDTQRLHGALFKEHHIDWHGVQDYLQEIAFTPQDWVQLMKLLDFVNEEPVSRATTELINTAFAGLRLASAQTKDLTPLNSLRLCFARVKVTPSWDLLCKTFILCNIVDLDTLSALTLLFQEHEAELQKRVSQDTAKDLVRYLAGYKHTRDEYTEMFGVTLDETHCKVRAHVVLQSLKQRDSLKEAMRQQTIASGAAFRKPSLTLMLEAKGLQDGAKHPQDGFRAFARMSKIAASVNVRVTQVAYYVVCLPDHVDKERQLSRVVGGDPIVLTSMLGVTIMSPDVQELRRIIMDTHYTCAPTDTLRRFKERCISSCLISAGKRSVSWSTVMRLYLAAYARAEIRKDLWSYVLHNESQGLQYLRASPETESVVHSYTQAHPMALGETVDVMLLGGGDGPPDGGYY